MAFNIEIISVTTERRDKFSTAVVNHKTADGKVDSKKVQSFTFKDVFDTLSKANQGDVFEIESKKIKNEKDGKEYWTWVSATPSTSGERPVNSSTAGKTVRTSTYETPEERAARQVYIVRQSSIANAIEYRGGQGKGNSVEDILEVAKQFEAYVFGNVKEAVLPSEVE